MKRLSILISGAIAATFVLGATEASAAAPSRSCFQMNQLNGTRADGDRRVYARVGLHDIWRIDLANRCSSLLSQEGIILAPTGGASLICTPLDLDLRAREIGGSSTPCIIDRISKLSPEEAAALPPKVKP